MKYTLNQNYFNTINSCNKAYFLGFIAGDGYIDVKNHSLSIAIKPKDRNILELFLKDIGSNHPIKTIIRNGYKENNEFVSLTIVSKKFIKGLKRHLNALNKTFTLTMPSIKKSLQKDFIRGLNDADGCFSISNRNEITFSLISTTSMCDSIQDIFIQELGLSKTKHNKTQTNNIVRLRYSGVNNLLKIYKFLYKNKNSICLNRKKDIIESYLKSKQKIK